MAVVKPVQSEEFPAEYQTLYNQVYANLKTLIWGPAHVIKNIASDTAKWLYVSHKQPTIRLTPESITITDDGKISISNARELTILWEDKTLPGLLKVSATAINDLITYKRKDKLPFQFGLFSGISFREEDGNSKIEPCIAIGCGYNLFWHINFYGAIGYPGLFGGFSYTMSSTYDIAVGVILDYKKNMNFALGINAKLW